MNLNINQNLERVFNLLNKLQNFIFPELLEDSKVISILSEDLRFKIDDLLGINEIQKLINNDKEELIKLLKQTEFVRIDESSEYCTIALIDDFVMFSLLNIPPNINKISDLLPLLKIDEFDRLYKKNFFVWYLVSTNPLSKDKLSKCLKSVQFGQVFLN